MKLEDLPEKYQEQARRKMGVKPPLPLEGKKSKFRNQKTEVDGIIFDSKAEARYYQTLKAYEKIGMVNGLKLQPAFELQPAYTKKNGEKIKAIVYKADFEYYDQNGNRVIVDVKGYKTEVYRMKKKIFEYKYPDLEITEVKP